MACHNPLWIKVKGHDMPVPCGKCPACKIRRVNEWVFRLMYEEEHNSSSSHFVTLTYDTKHVPLTNNGFMTLRKDDLQKYFKRLRKLSSNVLKYYAVGEYGSKYSRPHYHAIIFNCENSEYFADAWSLDGEQFGTVDVGTCTTDSIAYCLKYIDKDTFRQKKYKHDRDDRQSEFALMSKGLGKIYVENPSIVAYHQADLSRNFVTKLSGHKVAMPRYYRTKIFTEKQLEEQRFIIEASLSDKEQKERKKHGDSYQQHIDSKKRHLEGKFKRRQKNRDKF